MEVQLSDEEILLRDSILGQAEKLAPGSVEALEDYDDGALWERLAATGALGLGVPEEFGGAGTISDAAIATAALGRALAPVPFLGCAILPAHLLATVGADASIIDAVISGGRRIAIGIDPETLVIASESGPAGLAWDAAGAEAALVRSADGSGRLVAVALGPPTPGVDLTRRLRWCDLGRRVDVAGGSDGLGAVLEPDAERYWNVLAVALTAADMVGVMEGALQLAVEHATTREQFGVAIGSFQAIQHLLADQFASLEGSRSMAVYAAWALRHRSLDDAALAAHTAKAYASEAGKKLCEAVVQVHGGMGVTWECRAHVFLKRMLFDRSYLGDERHHFRRIAALRRQEVERGL